MDAAVTASAPTRAPRPPTRSDPNNISTQSAGVSFAPVMTETQGRRRLAQIEMRLRDMDEDAKRIQVLQEQEISVLQRENTKLRERLEVVRMEECMPPAEARALRDFTSAQRATGASDIGVESKLIGSTAIKYQNAKSDVQKRRSECTQAERELAEARARLADIRRSRRDLKRQSNKIEVAAAVRITTANHYKMLVYERLRGLEEQVAREQERLVDIVSEAKQARIEIDALLVSQTNHEKRYRSQYDALLMKRREMAFLMEVCNLLCEERQHLVTELTETQARLSQESDQYEVVFGELTGVQNENSKARETNRDQLGELRRSIAQTRAEREALEGENNQIKASLAGEDCRNSSRRLNNHAGADAEGGEPLARDGRAGQSISGKAASRDDDNTPAMDFDYYYRQLSSIVQSDALDDVVGFMNVVAAEHYRAYEEINVINRSISALETEKAARLGLLHDRKSSQKGTSFLATATSNTLSNTSEMAQPPPTSSTTMLSALASAETCEAFNKVLARKSDESNAPDDSIDSKQKRWARMGNLLDDLGTTRDLLCEQEGEHGSSDAVLTQVIAQVKEVFHGLGCSIDDLRALTGLENIQQSTLLQCLGLIEDRVSEYLIVYARVQQQHVSVNATEPWSDTPSDTSAVLATSSARNAARPLLRRPDLLPRARKNAAAEAVRQCVLPRSTDLKAVIPTFALLDTGTNTTFDDLVDKRPFSVAELKQILQAQRALKRL